MKTKKEFIRLCAILTACILLLTASGVSASATEPVPLLEIVYGYCHPAGPYCGKEKTLVFSDGRLVSEGDYPEESKSGRLRKVLFREEKQLEAGELAELVSWAEQPDFQNAQPEYLVKTVTDIPSDSFTITYRNKGREKVVKVFNFSAGSAAEKSKVPAAIVKLIKWTNKDYVE